MKTPTSLGNLTGLGTLAIAMFAGLAIASSANAQYKPTGDDGITASPRVRQQLDELKTRPPKLAKTAELACAKCQDKLVAVPNRESKGTGARALTGNTTQLVVKHLCPSCGTEWKVGGTGKAKTLVATHTCDECGSAKLACCSKDGAGVKVASKGMQQPVSIAPAK